MFYSYTLKCQTRSDFGKVTMEFELEMCQLTKSGALGIRRQRLKGDAWVYKRLIEDILSSCQVWVAVFYHDVLERSFQTSNSFSQSQLYVKNLSSWVFNHPSLYIFLLYVSFNIRFVINVLQLQLFWSEIL